MTSRRSVRWGRLLHGASRIAARLFAFNLLLLFLPIAAILYLDVYETRLLEFQERGMSQQGRLLAVALADSPSLDALYAAQVLARLGERSRQFGVVKRRFLGSLSGVHQHELMPALDRLAV